MEKDFAWETLEKEFATTNDAMKDPELVKMNEACELTQLHIRGNRITDTDTLLEECKKLDKGVAHLLEQPVGVTGRMQLYEGNDEEGFFEANDLQMQFNGFIFSTRKGQVEIDYQLVAAVGEDEQVIDFRHINEDTSYRIAFIQARRSEVDFDFDIVHPVQAAAWLDLMDETLVGRLDSYLLPEVEAGDRLQEINDPFSLISLNTLGKFELDLSHLESNPRTFAKTVQALNIYADSCLSYDKMVTHKVDIDGDCLLSSGGNFTPTQLTDADRLMIIKEISLQRRGEDQPYAFGFNGILLGKEPHEPPLGIITQFKDVSNIRSPLREA